MKLNCLLVIALILLPGFVRLADGQDEKLVLNPPLSQAFPLDPKPGEMRLKYPVLLNDHTVLGPNVVLRFIYVDLNAGTHPRGGGNGASQDTGGSAGGQGHHHGGASSDGGDAGSAYARTPGGDETAAPKDSPGVNKDAASEIRTEVWIQADLFREALDDAASLGTTVVYSDPSHAKPQSTTIDLPDGVLLAEVGDHVAVLGATADSKMFQAGLQPGDEIRSFGASRPVSSLKDFQRTYFDVKEEARKSGQPYSVEVWRPSESKLVTIQVTPPPSLQSLF